MYVCTCTLRIEMSLPYTNEDVIRADRMMYTMRNNIRGYFSNLMHSTQNAAKLLCASVTSCIHGIFPTTLKYTTLAICLSIVENDLMHNKIPNNHPNNGCDKNYHMHDV